MARTPVPMFENEIYHVFNRGVDKRKIFLRKSDYIRFYRSLYLFNSVDPVYDFRHAETQDKKNREALVEIHAYSLLPNHFHLLLKQCTSDGISEFMKRVSAGYTGYFNRKNGRSGSLFQGKFKRVHVEGDEQYTYLLAYVNENHVVHGLETERDLSHSSSLHYSNRATSKLIPVKNINYDEKGAVKLALSIDRQRNSVVGSVE